MGVLDSRGRIMDGAGSANYQKAVVILGDDLNSIPPSLDNCLESVIGLV